MSQQVSFRQYSGTAAENYQRYFVPAIGAPVAAYLLAAAALQPGERVLDLACGTGVVTRLAAEKVGSAGRVVGADVAADMIAVARSVAAPTGVEIEWHEADAASLPFPDDAFDVVLCQMGLMFMEDRAGALTEARRVLASAGRLVLSTPGTIQRPFEIMDEALVRHVSPDLGGFVRAVFSMDDAEALRGLVEEAGFEHVETQTTTTRLELPAPAEFLWQYIHATPLGGFVANAPDDAKAALERDVVEQWEGFVEDGATIVDQPMVVATAR